MKFCTSVLLLALATAALADAVTDVRNAEIAFAQAFADRDKANFRRMYEVLGPTIEKAVLSDDDLKKVTMPVLTLHGTKDRNVPIAGGKAWAAALPNDRFIAIENAAHEMWADQPAVVFAAIRQFLRGE